MAVAVTVRTWHSEHHRPADKNGYLACTLSNFAINAYKNGYKCKWSLRFCGQLQTGRRESSTTRSPFIMPIFRSSPRASTSSTLRYTIPHFYFVCQCSVIWFGSLDAKCVISYKTPLTFQLLHIIDKWHALVVIRACQGRWQEWFSGNSRWTMTWIFTK